MNNHVCLSIGSNLGNPLKQIKDSINMIAKHCHASILKKSKIYVSEPWGNKTQPSFLNVVVCINTTLQHQELLDVLKSIERTLGRKDMMKWGARKIDIDIISFNNLCIKTSSLTIPHQYLCHRNFVLIPLKEVCPNFIHPITKQHIDNIIAMCEDNLGVTPLHG